MPNSKAFYIDQLIRLSLIAVLVYWSFRLLLPLFSVLAWGLILAVALYPIYDWLYKHCWRQPMLAASIITLICLLLVVGSIVLLSNNMYGTVSVLITKLRDNQQIFPEPSYLKDFPLIGDQLYNWWSSAIINIGFTIKTYSSYLLDAGKLLLAKTASISVDIILFMISVIFSGFLLYHSNAIRNHTKQFAKRIAPETGITIVNLMKETIQNVSRGVIGLAFLQSILLGVLLLIAGTPGAGLISFLSLILCIAQLGQFLLIIPIMIWLFFVKSFIFASLISVALIVVGLLDNLLKPFVLARGLETPTLIIFLGVIGGIITHGIIGVFIGPVILAIFYDLLDHWVTIDDY